MAMAAEAMPSVFVSHGAPPLILDEGPARHFLSGLGRKLGRPSAILAVTAHWTTAVPTVGAASQPETLYDFHGFPEALYRLRYPAPGAPELADRARGLLDGAGLAPAVDSERGLDHGTWVPLMLMYPEADIPVAQLSVQPARDVADHLALGRALAPLRAEGVLVLGSGGAVHNLRAYRPGSTEVEPWAQAFAAWLDDTLMRGAVDDLAHWRERAPDGGRLAQPTDEHFLPLAVALGAAGPEPETERLYGEFEDGSLGLHAYAFR